MGAMISKNNEYGGYITIRDKHHPLADGAGYVRKHRAVLYASIGPGTHKCHWCDRIVEWKKGRRPATVIGALVVDHLDRNTGNNDIGNLVPSCVGCNATRGVCGRIKEGEPFILASNGCRHRAVNIPCAWCSKMFLSRVDQRGKPKNPHCSLSCSMTHARRTAKESGTVWRTKPVSERTRLKREAAAARKLTVKPAKIPFGMPRPTIEVKCTGCGVDFLARKRYERDEDEHRFCSRKCRSVWAASFRPENAVLIKSESRPYGVWHIPVTCTECGKDFLQQWRRGYAPKTCSQSCNYKYNGRMRMESKNTNVS